MSYIIKDFIFKRTKPSYSIKYHFNLETFNNTLIHASLHKKFKIVLNFKLSKRINY